MFQKTHKYLEIITFGLLLIGFTGCSDLFPPINDAEISDKNLEKVAPIDTHTLMVWGDNTNGQISNAPDGRFKAVTGGAINGLALRWDGSPVLWGSGPIGPPTTPDAIAVEKFLAADISRDDVVLIRQNRTLAAFGHNEAVINVPVGTYRSVSIAVPYAVAIAEDGTLATWGSNSFTLTTGEIVTGLLNAPKTGRFKEVSAIVIYSLALQVDGSLYGWGCCGSGTPINIFSGFFSGWAPTPEDQTIYYIPDQKFKAISAGNRHALAIRSNGTVMGWGDNSGGALTPPEHVRFNTVAAGFGFSIGLSTNGTLWGWGTPAQSPFATEGWSFADQGWTRYGNTEHYYVSDMRFKSISAAAFHIMAITK